MNSIGITVYTQITQCKHSKGDVDVIMTKFNIPKNIIKCTQNIMRTSSMCEQSECTKFEYDKMKTAGVTDYISQTPTTYFGLKKCQSSKPVKNKKILINVHKIKGALLQCVYNHHLKFEYKGIKMVELQISQTRHNISVLDGKMSKFNPP